METLAELQSNTEVDVWLYELKHFYAQYQDQSEFVPTSNEPTKKMCVHKLFEIVRHSLESDAADWNEEVLAEALQVLRILMRERIGIDELLTIDALFIFLKLAERMYSGTLSIKNAQVVDTIACEALKCSINSIYDRPEFVNQFNRQEGFVTVTNLMKIGPATASFHMLVCKCLVFACGESKEVIHELKGSHIHVISLIVPTLAYVLRLASPTFPHGKDRALLTHELLKLIYALASTGNHLPANEAHSDLMTQLGVLCCEILFLPHLPASVFETKSLVMNVLMHMPDAYPRYLVASQAIAPLMAFLELQMDMVLVEKSVLPQHMTSTIIVLNRLAQESGEARRQMKDLVFPPENDERLKHWRAEQRQHMLEKAMEAVDEGERELLRQELRDQALHPEDNDRQSLRGKLFKFMTCLETTMKRFTSEFVFTLCNEDPDEFTRRTGMGNAIALLKMKGLM